MCGEPVTEPSVSVNYREDNSIGVVRMSCHQVSDITLKKTCIVYSHSACLQVWGQGSRFGPVIFIDPLHLCPGDAVVGNFLTQ